MSTQPSTFKGRRGVMFNNLRKEVSWTECLCPLQNSDVETLTPNLM